jgi:hypothetical protein
MIQNAGDFAPGRYRPPPQYTPEAHLGQAPLHRRLQHPKMKRRQASEADEDSSSHAPAMTLRNARQCHFFPDAPVSAFEATFVSGDMDDDADDDAHSQGGPQSTPLDALRVPTAEEIHGVQSTSPTNSSRQKLFLPHAYESWGGPRGETRPIAATIRPSTASIRRKGPLQATDRHHAARLYHADFLPTAEDISKAAASLRSHRSPVPAYLLRPFHSSVPSSIPSFEGKDVHHAELLRLAERDNMCRSIQRDEEKKLLLKARVSQTHQPMPPERKPHPPRGAFPIATKLARMHQRMSGDAAFSPRVAREFVTPTFVLPSSRRYGSNKFNEAPQAKMAYEHDEDEVDSTAALVKFERAHPRAL